MRPSRRPRSRLAAASLIVLVAAATSASAGRLSFSDLPGWAEDEQAAAFRALRKTCPSGPSPAICAEAARLGEADSQTARVFFERWFEPFEVASDGFLTGYFEPEIPGSLTRDDTFRFPLLARPASAGRPIPDRAAIEDGALGTEARPIVFLADPVDSFTVHVQGSARIRLPGGEIVRASFDGKNGHPYTSIGKVLAAELGVPPSEMTADKLWDWLRDHPDRAPAIMRANRSFIFFRLAPIASEDGPTGGAGVPLTAGRSLAVDRAAWRYGTPVWLEGEIPAPSGGTVALRRLLIAQDTGSAIVGRARGDLFFGSGAEAGAAASGVRHPVRWIVLRPKVPRRPGAARAP